jgi:phenylalanyl-tRNA synthetase alpha chain
MQTEKSAAPAEKLGHLHPLTQIIREICGIFGELGFEVTDGPELEDEFHNFDALNMPHDHPSRDMQDTFWIKDQKGAAGKEKGERTVLRTQTSSVQIRFMEENIDKLPCRIIVPGKVFRNEATDATHEAQFHQIEALYVDKNVSLAHLKGVLEHMFKKLFGPDVEIRFRPSFFPFVEPAVEVDMRWKGKWLEMGGAGLVNPKVFEAVGVDPTKWQGFAFGFGVDRIAMLKFGIDDIRLLYGGDLRFIDQF